MGDPNDPPEVLVAAYARLHAEGDEAGKARLRARLAKGQAGGAAQTPQTFSSVSSGHAAFHQAIDREPTDHATRGVYADWIEDHDPHSVDPEGETLAALRTHRGYARVGRHPETNLITLTPVSRARHVGERVGRAMARSVAREDVGGHAPGGNGNGFELDPQDADQLDAAGIEYGTPEWREAVGDAERAFLEHFGH